MFSRILYWNSFVKGWTADYISWKYFIIYKTIDSYCSFYEAFLFIDFLNFLSQEAKVVPSGAAGC